MEELDSANLETIEIIPCLLCTKTHILEAQSRPRCVWLFSEKLTPKLQPLLITLDLKYGNTRITTPTVFLSDLIDKIVEIVIRVIQYFKCKLTNSSSRSHLQPCRYLFT